MRVALVCHLENSPPRLRTVEQLAARGCDAQLVVRTSKLGPRLHVPPRLRDRVHFCAPVERFCSDPLSATLGRLRPELVHAPSLELAVACRDGATRAGAKVVASIGGDGVELGDYTGAEVPWHAADAFHFADPASQRLAERRGLPANVERAVIAAKADSALFELKLPRGSGDGPLRIVSVAPLHWSQGLEHAIHGLALAVERGVDAHYAIVGSGELLPALTLARHQLGIVERVTLHERAVEQLELADIALSAQLVDGLSDGVVQALAAGLPIVLAGAGDLEALSPVPEAALWVPRRDPEAIAEGICRLAADPALRARMGAAGRERARARHRPELELDGLEELYRRVGGEEPATRIPVLAER